MMPVIDGTVGRYKYFSVVKASTSVSGQTNIYDVVSNGGAVIAAIVGGPGWGQHVFRPRLAQVWTAGELADIQDCLAKLNKR